MDWFAIITTIGIPGAVGVAIIFAVAVVNTADF